VDAIRWWINVFEQVGENTPAWEIIFATGVEMARSATRVKEDKEKMKRYPFHLLFHSEESMDYVLRKELKYDETDIDRFNNLYLTPFFPICAFDIVIFKGFYQLDYYFSSTNLKIRQSIYSMSPLTVSAIPSN
jgi:hypothetical protein